MPHLITKADVAASVKDRFAQQYGPSFDEYPFGDSSAIYRQLLKLGDKPDAASIEALMPGWTRLNCDDCGNDVDAVVEVGQEPDYESATAHICVECIAKASELFAA